MNNNINFSLPVNDVQIITNQKTVNFDYNDYFFFIVLDGKLEIVFEGKSINLRSGDIYFRSHIIAGKANIFTQSTVLIVSLSSEFISPFVPTFPFEFIVNSQEFPHKHHKKLISLLLDISYQFLADAPDYLMLMSLCYDMTNELVKNFTIFPEENKDIPDKNISRARRVANYINQNYNTHITLSDMANHLYISPQHCSRFFKQFFKTTFLEYLNYVRLQHALEQIQYDDVSITQIAFQNGFPNLNSFNKVFKAHLQTTPNEYRKQVQAAKKESSIKNKQMDTSDSSLDRLKRYEYRLNLTTPIREHTQKPEELVLYAKDSGTEYPFWSNIMNLGLLVECLMHNYYVQLADICASLRFQYVRFHGVLDDAIIPQIPNSSKYNFQHIDMLFDYFQELELIPFIEIGNKPRIQSFALSNLESELSSEEYNPYTLNIEKLAPFIKHCIHRYGINTVENWCFEIWMDFDQYFNVKDITIPMNSYIEHYRKCVYVIKSLVPNAKVGGPGFNAIASIDILQDFFKKITAEDLSLDFISACLYPYEAKSEETIKRGQSIENIIVGSEQLVLKRLDVLSTAITHSAHTKKPLYITEYHFSISPRNFMNDTCYLASFVMKTLIENTINVQGFGFFRTLDMSSNYTDAIGPLFGGLGLVTKDNIKKPAYYAHLFIQSIKGELIDKGKGYVLTKVNGHKYFLLLYHYMHPDTDYLLQPKNYPPRYYSDKVYPSMMKKNYHIVINNMKATDYIVRNRFVNRNNGSVLNEWVLLNSSPYLSRSDISYLKNICVPHQTIEMISSEDQRLTITTTLIPHEIRLIEITSISDS